MKSFTTHRTAGAPRLFTALILLVFAGACGAEVPAGGVPVKTAHDTAAATTVTRAPELIPADLDIVVRLDLTEARAALGPDASEQLLTRALDEAPDRGLARKAVADAAVVWLGLRGADLDTGDRVMVVRARERSEIPDRLSWVQRDTALDGVLRHDNRGRVARDGTATIFRFGARDAVFVSPVELHSVERLMRTGADAERGQPEARGLLSVDYRARRLPPSLEDRYPSLAALVRGIRRFYGSVAVAGDGLELEGRIRCTGPNEANKIIRFLLTLRDAASERAGYTEVLSGLSLKRADSNVNLRWVLRRDSLRELLRRIVPKRRLPNFDLAR